MFTAQQVREATSYKKAAEMIEENINADDEWLVRGLLAIYQRQTSDEQASEATRHNNQRGFNGLDAHILSSFAAQVLRWQKTPPAERRFPNPLSPKQIAICRRKMRKYCAQLALIARPRPVAVESAA